MFRLRSGADISVDSEKDEEERQKGAKTETETQRNQKARWPVGQEGGRDCLT
jgi:hypothetical protein